MLKYTDDAPRLAIRHKGQENPHMKENDMKVYCGNPTKDGVLVTVRVESHSEVLPRHRLNDETYSWGTEANGSLELARCLLLHAFGSKGCPTAPETCTCANQWADDFYGAFCADIIAKFSPADEWKLTQTQVCNYAFDQREKIAKHIQAVTSEGLPVG